MQKPWDLNLPRVFEKQETSVAELSKQAEKVEEWDKELVEKGQEDYVEAYRPGQEF